MPALHPIALLPDTGRTTGHRDVRRDDGCADLRTGVVDRRLQIRLAGSQATDQDSGLAASRDCGGPVAGSRSRRVDCSHPGRSTGAAVLHHQLRRQALPSGGRRGEHRVCGGSAALPASPAQPRSADAGGRSRPPQLHRHAHRQQGRQGHLPPTRTSPGCRRSPGRSAHRSTAPRIPYIVGQQGVNQKLGQSYGQARTADLLSQAADINNSIDILKQQLTLQTQSAGAQQEQADLLKQTVVVTQRPSGQDRQLR